MNPQCSFQQREELILKTFTHPTTIFSTFCKPLSTSVQHGQSQAPVFHPPTIYEVICAWMVIDIRASMNHSRSISDSTPCSHLRHRHAITPFQNRPKRRHVFSSAISCNLNVPRVPFSIQAILCTYKTQN